MKSLSKIKLTAKSWNLDESDLSDADKKVLETVGFPKSLKSGLVLVRRTAKRNVGKIGWIDKDRIEMTDVRYLTTSYKVANMQVSRMTPHTHDAQGKSRSDAELKIDAQKIEEMQTSKSFSQVYIDAENIQEELEDLLMMFSDPKPTKGMKEITSTADTSGSVKEPKGTGLKSLSNKDKGIAKRMYQEESKDLDEITAELGVERERVLEYLKTLQN